MAVAESDSMINFLYNRRFDKVRVAASTELFTQMYLRRHFAWYNSDLWLDEVKAPVVVALSGQDTIVAAHKVRKHASFHDHVDVVFWEDAEHADC